MPRTVDGDELAVRAVLGQQVSTAAARRHAARLVEAHGQALPESLRVDDGSLTHLFPRRRGPGRRRRAVGAGSGAPATPPCVPWPTTLAEGRLVLDPDADRDRARAQLEALAGIGPWTQGTIAMRALGDPDAFVAGDLGVRTAAAQLGLPTGPRALEAHSAAWTPWRAYATQYLWGSLDHPVAHLRSHP